MDAPYGDQEDGEGKDFGTLYSEVMGSALAVGDKYAVIIWTDNSDTWRTPPAGGRGGSSPGTATAIYVGIYDIATGKAGHFKMIEKGAKQEAQVEGVDVYATVTPDNVLAQSGIGSPGSLATRGDYVLVGSSNSSGLGTAAFRIGADFALTNVTPETITDSIAGQNDKTLSHWMVDNGDYAMDCGPYTVKVWKWNGSSEPTESIIDGLGADAPSNRSYVRQVCYDQDDPSKAYVLVKNSATTTTSDKPNGFYSLDLAAGTKEYLFMPIFTNDDDTTYAVSPWGCERFKKGDDTWYVVVGATVEAFKNPPTQAADANNITITPDWHLEMSESVHIAKAFNANGRYFLAVKEGINEDFPVEGALVLHEITD
jgi:hypothetical protein